MAISLEEAMAKHEMERRAIALRMRDSVAYKTAAAASTLLTYPNPEMLRAAERALRTARGIFPRV